MKKELGLRLLLVSPVAFIEMLKGGPGFRVTMDALPKDAEKVLARFDEVTDCFRILIKSDEWKTLNIGELVPQITPVFERIAPDKENDQ